ncbi:MAG: hypothetical protein JJT77_01700 [Crocinitomicaceae bacterium]|nr:hypothetical protein [Crocinitomicaceae bacterium]
MTKKEFLNKVPYFIKDKNWGEGEHEILIDNKDKKGVCYRHSNNLTSCGTYGTSWLEVYEKLIPKLKSRKI